MLDVARGDRAVNQYLRESLTVLRDNSQDKEFCRLADDVLSGKASLREAAFTEIFERAVGQPLQENMRHEEPLSEAELQRLAAAGEAEFALLNEQLAAEERGPAERDGRTRPQTPAGPAAEAPHYPPARQTIMPTVYGSDRFS
jgi:hypothetical protein